MKRLIAIWAFAGLAAALCLAAVPIAGLKLTTGADGGGTNSWTNAVDYGTTGGVTLLNAMTTGQLALTRADAANVTGGIAVGFANAASNLAVLVQGTQVTVQGWAVAASNLAVALQGSQAVIRADVATVSNLANAAQTAGEVAAAIAEIQFKDLKYRASSNIVVSGAGSNVVDGTYTVAGNFGGGPYWTNGTAASVFFWSGGSWYINSELNAGLWYYYDNASSTVELPLAGSWSEYTGGVAPAPTLAWQIVTNTIDTEAAVLYAPTGTLGTAAYQASSAFDAAGSALAATNGLALPFTAFTPTSRWVAATGGVARGLLLFDDPGLRWSGTNGYAILATNTAPDGYSFGAMQNNSEDVLSFGVRGTAAAGTLFGVTNAGSAQVYSFAAPLLLGSYGSDPVIFGVNNAERFRMTTAGNTNVADLVVTGALAVGGAATVTGPTTNTGGAYYPGTTFEDDQLATAGWVRDLLAIGEPVYMASNTEAVGYYPGTASKGINEASAGNYVSPSVTITGSPQYVHSMIGTQVLSGTLLGPASVDVYVWRKGTGPVGSQSASLAAELYYTMDKTNLFGDWSAPAQTIPSGTNKLSYVISFPNTDVTNAYLVYRLKITAAANTTNINVLGGETYGSYALLRIPNTDSLGVRGATNLTDAAGVYTSRYDVATRTLDIGPTQAFTSAAFGTALAATQALAVATNGIQTADISTVSNLVIAAQTTNATQEARFTGWTNSAALVTKDEGGSNFFGVVFGGTNYWFRLYP